MDASFRQLLVDPWPVSVCLVGRVEWRRAIRQSAFALRRFDPRHAYDPRPVTDEWATEIYDVVADPAAGRYGISVRDADGWRGVRSPSGWWVLQSPNEVVVGDEASGVECGNFDFLVTLVSKKRLSEDLEFDLFTVAKANVGGRSALQAAAHSIVGPNAGLGVLASGADWFEIALDSDTGAVLRTRSFLDDEMIDEMRFAQFVTQSVVPDTAFEPRWPSDVRIIRAEYQHR